MEAIRRSPDNPRAYYQIGRIFQDAGQLPAAAASYNKALELKPGYPEAAEAMAGIYAQTKSPEKAKELYQQAEKTGGESAELYFNRGVASYKNNDFAGAEAAYLKALELDPKFYKAYNNLAVVQIQAQRYDEAVESCRKSLEINPRYGVTHFNLGNAYLKMKDYPRAMAEFKTAQSLMPGDPGVQMRIAETERLLK
jgi:superkiller protein 3